MMRRLAALLLALCVFALSGAALGDVAGTDTPTAAEAAEEAPDTGADEGETGTNDEAGEDASAPAPGYVLVTASGLSGWLPLPAEGEKTFPLPQVLPDGTQTLNIIHLTPNSVYMEDSTCENHDCVDQGIVSFENKEERILGNMIVCLPNQVLLELYTAEEVAELVAMGMPAP